VKHDGFDEKLRDPGLVEHWMNSDQAFFGKVGSELERALAAFGPNALAPGNAYVDLCPKVPAGKVVCDCTEIVVAAFVAQGLLWRTWRDEPAAVRFDELVDGRGCFRGAAAQVVADGIEDVFVGGQEHVMEAHLESSVLGSSNQHRAPIVSDDESNGLTKARREGAAPVGRTGIGALQIVRATLGDAALRDRRRLAGKLEGKLEHPCPS